MRGKFDFSQLFKAFKPREENSHGSPMENLAPEYWKVDLVERVLKVSGQPIRKVDAEGVSWSFTPGIFLMFFSQLNVSDDQKTYVDKEDFKRLYELAKTYKIPRFYLCLKLLFNLINADSGILEDKKLPEFEWFRLSSSDLILDKTPSSKEEVMKWFGGWSYIKDREPRYQLLLHQEMTALFPSVIACAELGILGVAAAREIVDYYFKRAASSGSYYMLVLTSIFKKELMKISDDFNLPTISELVKELDLVTCFLDAIDHNKNVNPTEIDKVANFLLIKFFGTKITPKDGETYEACLRRCFEATAATQDIIILKPATASLFRPVSPKNPSSPSIEMQKPIAFPTLKRPREGINEADTNSRLLKRKKRDPSGNNSFSMSSNPTLTFDSQNSSLSDPESRVPDRVKNPGSFGN